MLSRKHRSHLEQQHRPIEEFICRGDILADESESKTSEQHRSDDRCPSGNGIFCRMLLDAVKEPSDHIRKLDDVIRRLAELKITFSLLPELDLAHRAVDVL